MPTLRLLSDDLREPRRGLARARAGGSSALPTPSLSRARKAWCVVLTASSHPMQPQDAMVGVFGGPSRCPTAPPNSSSKCSPNATSAAA